VLDACRTLPDDGPMARSAACDRVSSTREPDRRRRVVPRLAPRFALRVRAWSSTRSASPRHPSVRLRRPSRTREQVVRAAGACRCPSNSISIQRLVFQRVLDGIEHRHVMWLVPLARPCRCPTSTDNVLRDLEAPKKTASICPATSVSGLERGREHERAPEQE